MPFNAPQRAVERVFLHCSASDHPDHDDVSVMRDWHVNGNGWSDVGYHFFVRKNGTLQPGRDLERSPAAQRGHNTGTIAICLHGLAEERFTPAQFETLIALCEEIDEAYERQATFHGHCEVSSKSCPVFDYRRVLGLDEDGAMVLGTETKLEAPAPTTPRPILRLTSRGDAVTVLQGLLNRKGASVAEDGIFGHGTFEAVKSFQGSDGLKADGIVGPRTWAALTS